MTIRSPFDAGRLTILFDLDGTLVDTIAFILASMRFAFAEHAGPRPSDAEWTAGVGTPLRSQLREWARDEAEVERLALRYRTHQRANLAALTRVFPGVRETLAALRERGHPMAIVTSKAEEIARLTLEQAGLLHYMDAVIGVESSLRHKPDPEPVRVALERTGGEPARALFLGDSPHDIAAGNAAGVQTVAVAWGPFSRETLLASGPTWWLETIAELPPLVERVEAVPVTRDDRVVTRRPERP
jgi:pyrophosphatase PpaX